MINHLSSLTVNITAIHNYNCLEDKESGFSQGPSQLCLFVNYIVSLITVRFVEISGNGAENWQRCRFIDFTSWQ